MNYKNDYVLLDKSGLSKEMLLVYKTLLNSGFSTAGKISKKTGFKRSYTYKLLDQLIEKNLVNKNKKTKNVTFFYPKSPEQINELIEETEKGIDTEKIKLNKQVSEYLSLFNMLEGKPNILFSEGIEGIKKLYKDILIEKSDIKLIRSIKDKISPELTKLLNEQRDLQKKEGIKISVIGPLNKPNKNQNIKTLKEHDQKYLISRKIVDAKEFQNEAQILIYGNKVAITSYDDFIITTTIESPAIKKTFESIFNLLWSGGKNPY